MKKHKICKILLVILAIFLCVAFYELIGICIAYKKQPEVSNTTKKETKNGSWNECSENTERAVIIEKNPEALLQRVRLIQNAKEEIILSTFAFKSDESGKLILGALHDAADRGVHIRLLVDGMESWIDMEGNPYFYGLSSHENVEIKLYNKANPLKPWKIIVCISSAKNICLTICNQIFIMHSTHHFPWFQRVGFIIQFNFNILMRR